MADEENLGDARVDEEITSFKSSIGKIHDSIQASEKALGLAGIVATVVDSSKFYQGASGGVQTAINASSVFSSASASLSLDAGRLAAPFTPTASNLASEIQSSIKSFTALSAGLSLDVGQSARIGEMLHTTRHSTASVLDALTSTSGLKELAGLMAPAIPSFHVSSSLLGIVAESARVKYDFLAPLLSEYNVLGPLAYRTSELQSLLGQVNFARPGILEGSRELASSLSGLSAASASVLSGFELSPTLLRSSPGWVFEAPIVQTHDASLNIAQIVSAEEDREVEATTAVANHTSERDSVVMRLHEVGPEFSEAFLGAQDALRAKNRDYIRHAAVSLRELLDKLLERLAPADEVKRWEDGPALLAKNQVHKARLMYLFRDLLSGPYADFMLKDIDLILQTFYALNKATHVLDSPYSDDVLRVLLARVEGHVLVLLTRT